MEFHKPRIKKGLVSFIFGIFLFTPAVLYAEGVDHNGWNIGAAGVLHSFYFDTDDDNNSNPSSRVGGGVDLSGAYRFGRWEMRLNLNLAGVQVEEEKSPDFLTELSIEPIYHFRKNPKRWDPYISIPEIGLAYLARNQATGFSLVAWPPGLGLQVHLNEQWSLYTGFKLRWGLLFIGDGPSGISVDGEFPLGVIFRF